MGAKRFEEICETTKGGTEESQEALFELFDIEEQAGQLFDWYCSTVDVRRCVRAPVIPEPKELKAMINSVDFACMKQVEHLEEVLNLSYALSLSIGTFDGAEIRLYTGTALLGSDEPIDYKTILDKDQLLSESILGVKMITTLATEHVAQDGDDTDKESNASSRQIDSALTPPTTPPNSFFYGGFTIQQLEAFQYNLPSCLEKGESLQDS